MSYDSWKTRNPDDETLGPEPPPCYEQGSERRRVGICDICGAGNFEVCKLLPRHWGDE